MQAGNCICLTHGSGVGSGAGLAVALWLLSGGSVVTVVAVVFG